MMNWEEKQTKTQISKETCKQELLRETKATLPLTALCVVLFTVAGILFLAIDSKNHLGNTLSRVLGLVFIGTAVFLFYRQISAYIKIKKGRIEIREDGLEKIAVETVRRRSRHGYTYHEEKVFYFNQHGRYVTSKEDGSAFEYSNVGDRFYLLLYHGTIKPLRIYNAKVYEYRA